MQRVYLEQVAPLLNQSQITQLQIITVFSDAMTMGARTSKDFVKIAVLVFASDAPLVSIEITTSSILMSWTSQTSRIRAASSKTKLTCSRKRQRPCLIEPKIARHTSSSCQTSQEGSQRSRTDSEGKCFIF